MSEPFIGEVRVFAGSFAPRNWAFCDGQLLPIAQNQALFSILGTTYGGDGRTNFALPDLRGRMPTHAGQGPGLTPHTLGERSGQPAVTLTAAQMPSHTHTLRAADGGATTGTPGPGVAMAATAGAKVYRAASNLVATAAPLASTGGAQAHENRQPFLGVNFIIALFGIFPSRN
ncbi:MAG: phage tail protein [Leptothrix sp. (in: Bacteria)]|nr:phage tail protein [Leptothrix sp. (in: b-proteobacteria)]